MYVYTVVFFNLKNSEIFDIINYKIEKGKICTMKVKEIIELLKALDGDLDVRFIDLYDVGIEVMTVDDDFYYSDKE